jgi:hypothetical protein
MPRSRYHILNGQSPRFMTEAFNRWLPLFTDPVTADIVKDSWWFLHLRLTKASPFQQITPKLRLQEWCGLRASV